MERRNFIVNSIAGMLCISEVLSAPKNKFSTDVVKYFSNYVDLAGAKKAQGSIPEAMATELSDIKRSLIKVGYKPENNFYTCSNQEIAIIPFKLRTAETGTIDITALFAQKVKGQWKKTGVLSGFHFEAIANFMNISTSTSIDFVQLFLPVHTTERNFSAAAIPTKNGFIELQTKVSNGHTVSSLKVTSRNGEALANTQLNSKHSLRYESLS